MILIATCSEYPHPTPNLEAILNAFHSLGVKASYLPWKTTSPDMFARADAVLPLCCWDYHDDPKAFLAWIDALQAKGARLINDPDLLRWNFRKTYLLEIAKAGLPVPKTFHLPEVSRAAIMQRMEQEGWPVAVLKPVSGQSGYAVQKLDGAKSAEWSFDRATSGEALLQEFQAEISALGETTLTFIEGAFSHAVRRVLKPGEWRANAQYGITYERVDVSADVIETAQAYVKRLPQTPLYARVDGLARPNGFMLMELELIEPYLYCEFAPGSAETLARSVMQRIG